MRKPELLAPAGDMERLRMAVLYGADAVYLAGTSFGMRSFAGNFSPEELPEAVAFAHAHGVRVHVTVNTMPRGDELPALPAHLRLLNDSGVDALILADLGVFRMAQREAPNCELHISTQVSIANAACAAAWHELGAKRVVLARELSLEEIRVIRRDTPPELELETFAHGAMCVSYSGRCLLSNYMTGRDSNRGACAQPCRYQYALMEEKRPGEYFPVFEDEKGTYIMNSRDMCMIDHLAELTEAGVDCIKVEGRAKSAYYAAIITGAYRHALDAVAAGEPVDPVWRDEVEHVSHRRYSTGFFFGQPGQYTESSRYIRDWQVCAIVTDCTPDGMATLSLRNKFAAGDVVEIVGPDTRPFSVTVPVMQDADGLPLREPRTPQMVFRMQLPRPDGMRGVEQFRTVHPSLVLLDVMLPGLDGWGVCRAIRAESQTPIIMLTAKSETEDKVNGLKQGADDYITKPFEMKEVLARIEAVLRRSGIEPEKSRRRLEFDKLVIDMDAFELTVDGKKVPTPPKEMELLYHLASTPNRVYTRNQLLDEVWGFDYFGDTRTVDVHIKRLREKLEGVSDQWDLKTVWSVGYKFEVK